MQALKHLTVAGLTALWFVHGALVAEEQAQQGTGEAEVRQTQGSANDQQEGYEPGQGDKPNPYHGYYHRALTEQGEYAPGGPKSYIVDGHMSRGFALLAYPADYGSSGRQSQ